MKKTKSLLIFFTFLFIIVFSIYLLTNKKIINILSTNNIISEEVTIDDSVLSIEYIDGNLIDVDLSFNNKIEKVIKVNNKNNKDVSFAIAFNNQNVSNDIKYDVLYSSKNENVLYEPISKNNSLNNITNLAYNLNVEKNNYVYIKIVFTATKESTVTHVEGNINIITNLTDKQVFINKLNDIQDKVDDKINSINGIYESAYYILNVDNLVTNYKGYVLIDATDISSIDYIYTIYNDKLIIKSKRLSTIKNSDIEKIDNSYINTINSLSVCRLFTKRDCIDFNTLKASNKETKDDFIKSSKKIIDIVKTKYENGNYTNDSYIFDLSTDITNDTSLKGYILINKGNYYLYITNNIFMISGYNYTKYGNYDTSSSTVRAYNETAYNLSSKDKKTVCSFTGIEKCYDANNKLV